MYFWQISVVKTLLWIWLGLSLVTSVWSADITVFGSDSTLPKMFQQERQSRGILVDILKYADHALQDDSNVTVKLYPWARAYRYASAGAGGIVGLSWTQERTALFDFSEPLYVDDVVIVVRKGYEFNFKELADLQGLRVGLGRGESYGDEFERARTAGVFIAEEDNSVANRLSKLVMGRIDCALFNAGKAGVEELLRHHQIPAAVRDVLVVLPVPLRSHPNFLAFPKSMQMKRWLAEFNQVIKRGYASGDIPRIIAQNLGAPPELTHNAATPAENPAPTQNHRPAPGAPATAWGCGPASPAPARCATAAGRPPR